MAKVLDLSEYHRRAKESPMKRARRFEPMGRWDGQLTLVLSLPGSELSPNSRAHWASKARAAKRSREESKTLAFGMIHDLDGFPWKSATIEVTFYKRTAASADRDNLLASCKPIFDGLQDAGVIENDAGFTYLPVRLEKDAANPRLELVIRRTPTP